MSIRRLALLTILVLLGIRYVTAQPSLQGEWGCSGTATRGDYDSPLTIVQNGAAYELTWGPTMRGVGILEDNRLAVGMVLLTPDLRSIVGVGVASYRVTANQLDGRWVDRDGVKYTEVCTRGSKPA